MSNNVVISLRFILIKLRYKSIIILFQNKKRKKYEHTKRQNIPTNLCVCVCVCV